MTNRLRDAVQSVNVPPELTERVLKSIRSPRSERQGQWLRYGSIAAAVILAVGALIGYQRGHLRLTAASRESYISSVSSHLRGVARTALGDHINCAVFRKYSSNPPTVEEFAQELGPKYKDLVPAIAANMPGDLRIVMAHHCSYHGRPFVHVILRNRESLMSLVIAERGVGEMLDWNHADAQRFQIAAFETPGHLVYVISDLPSQQNQAVMTALSPWVRAVLRKSEGWG